MTRMSLSLMTVRSTLAVTSRMDLILSQRGLWAVETTVVGTARWGNLLCGLAMTPGSVATAVRSEMPPNAFTSLSWASVRYSMALGSDHREGGAASSTCG